mmetsp:Transcript_45943/g.99813  ORF Transcript_45943/g.99813 Transcript_45943/m.99813 type:complete len:220 (-) Transcript_45943:716-1375(-)
MGLLQDLPCLLLYEASEDVAREGHRMQPRHEELLEEALHLGLQASLAGEADHCDAYHGLEEVPVEQLPLGGVSAGQVPCGQVPAEGTLSWRGLDLHLDLGLGLGLDRQLALESKLKFHLGLRATIPRRHGLRHRRDGYWPRRERCHLRHVLRGHLLVMPRAREDRSVQPGQGAAGSDKVEVPGEGPELEASQGKGVLPRKSVERAVARVEGFEVGQVPQ